MLTMPTTQRTGLPASRLGRARRSFRLYAALMGASLRSEAQYRANLLVQMLGAIAHQTAGFAFIWVVIERFGVIGGWTLAEIAFLYGMRLTAHGLFTFVASPVINAMDVVLREGEFDRYLVRPLNPFLQLVTRRFTLLAVGDLGGGIALLATAATLVDVDWSPSAVGYLVLAVVGGAMVEGAIQVAISGLSFRLLSTESFRFGMDAVLTTFGGYPLTIFPAAARFGLTFVIPLAFLAYFPASVLLDRTGELAVPPWIAALAPLAGAVLLGAGYVFWRHQTRHYSSSGH